ncbi:hypothetical protein [Enterocloster sp.]|uniref:hypothetical protein n=1 Tax=Enterocloster sp. TaxID=2719315 RepID=UPI0039A3BC04
MQFKRRTPGDDWGLCVTETYGIGICNICGPSVALVGGTVDDAIIKEDVEITTTENPNVTCYP